MSNALPAIQFVLVPFAQSGGAIHPIVMQSPDGPKAALLGASSGSHWHSPEKCRARVNGGEQYQLYSLLRPAGAAVGDRPVMEAEDIPQFYLALKPRPVSRTVHIGVAGRWNAMPRRMRNVSLKDSRIVKAATQYLRSRNLLRPEIRIKQALRGDLDGDGRAETLAVAERYGPSGVPDEAKSGDYSVVLLLTHSPGKPQTIRIASEIYPPGKPAVEPAPPNVRKIVGVLDLNGDRKMEIVVEWTYYEGGGYDVYTIEGPRVRRVLAWSAGL